MWLVYNRIMTVWLQMTENIIKSQGVYHSLFKISYNSKITTKSNYNTFLVTVTDV